MADGLDKLIGDRVVTLTLNGREYRISTAVLADHAEKESHIHSLRPPLRDLLRQIPVDLDARVMQGLQESVLKVASRPAFISQDEEMEFDASLHGVAWRLWRGMRDHHEEFGLITNGQPVEYRAPNGRAYSMTPADGVQAMLDFMERIGNEKLTELQAAVDEAEEKDILGNSSGSAKKPATRRARTTASRGHKSSEDSVKSTDGHGTKSDE